MLLIFRFFLVFFISNFLVAFNISSDLPPLHPTLKKICFREAIRTANYTGGIRPDFRHTTHYTHELPTTPIKDQCGIGACWIYGTLSHLENRYLLETKEHLKLSEEYLLYYHIYSTAINVMKAATMETAISEGSSSLRAFHLIQNYGVLPESVFKPAVDIRKQEHSKRLYYFLNNILAYHHEKKASLKSETKINYL